MLDIVMFGEVLWDIIDGREHIGGAPFNLAAHAVQCGLKAAMVSRLGEDRLGYAAREHILRHGVADQWVNFDTQHATGTVTVTLRDGQPSYEINKNSAWDFIELSDAQLRELLIEEPRAFCFGTLAQRSEVSRQTLFKLLDTFTDLIVFYDVNLRQNFWSAESVATSLARADIIKVNQDEAQTLGALLFAGAYAPEEFGHALLRNHPRAEIVLVTLGADGCVVCERNQRAVRCPVKEVEVVDTVGAGDAFSAAFLAAWLKGADGVSAAQAATEPGALVASCRGAIPELQMV